MDIVENLRMLKCSNFTICGKLVREDDKFYYLEDARIPQTFKEKDNTIMMILPELLGGQKGPLQIKKEIVFLIYQPSEEFERQYIKATTNLTLAEGPLPSGVGTLGAK